MPKHPYIEIALCLLMIAGPGTIIWLRFRTERRIEKPDGTVETRPWGIGVRMVQLIALLLVAPLVAVLGLEGILSGEGTGTLIGAIVGYALGGITAPVPKGE